MRLCGFDVGIERPLFLIAGPCVIENEPLCLRVADRLRAVCDKLGITYIFKASFDKANRTSAKSFRGLGLERGLAVLAKVRAQVGVPILTDIRTGLPHSEQAYAWVCYDANWFYVGLWSPKRPGPLVARAGPRLTMLNT